jgi:hypothetical protein
MADAGEDEDPRAVDERLDDDTEHGAAVEAPFDPVIAEGLDAPSQPEAIYEEEASLYRPVSTGDLFHGVRIEGQAAVEAPHDHVLIVSHPSAMRDGAKVCSTVQAAPVVPVNGVRSRNWTTGFYDIFPLPLLREAAEVGGLALERRGWAARLDLSAPLSKDAFDVRRRFACLSPEGVHLLLQRLVHADTRVAVSVKTLAATFAPKLVELDLLYTWNEELVPPRVEAGSALEEELLVAAQQFEDLLDAPVGDSSIRLMLGQISKSGEAGRAGEAQRRFNEALAAQRRRDQSRDLRHERPVDRWLLRANSSTRPQPQHAVDDDLRPARLREGVVSCRRLRTQAVREASTGCSAKRIRADGHERNRRRAPAACAGVGRAVFSYGRRR